MKMNKEKLYNKLESMTREQLLELCKSTTNIVDDLQERIDKAINYIKEVKVAGYIKFIDSDVLIDILRGGENECY